VKKRDLIRFEQFDIALQRYSAERYPLAGIADDKTRAVFVHQLIDSLHRTEYPRVLSTRTMSVRRTDPMDDEYFDPVRGAVYYSSLGNHDEACWLIFLFVTFGKGRRTGWRLIQNVYGRLGEEVRWDWAAASETPELMANWIVEHAHELWPKGTPRPFGAHRQHEQIAPSGRTVETYVRWIGDAGHRVKFEASAAANNGDPRRTFDALYREMAVVHRYGRLAKFDYLAMLGKLSLALVEPGSTYMAGATGPVTGARLFFAADARADLSADFLDTNLAELDTVLGVGMQALEDALCNWQKSPRKFKPFRG